MTNNFKPNKGGYRQPQLSPRRMESKETGRKGRCFIR